MNIQQWLRARIASNGTAAFALPVADEDALVVSVYERRSRPTDPQSFQRPPS